MIDERIKNIKIYVDGRSAEIQEVLFALGAKWNAGKESVLETDQPFLYINSAGAITYGSNMNTFVNNTEKKEVSASDVLSWKPVKPKPVLKPFDRVLVRDLEENKWDLSFYGYEGDCGEFYACNGSYWCQCIPYDGNEHLLGTTDSPEE